MAPYPDSTHTTVWCPPFAIWGTMVTNLSTFTKAGFKVCHLLSELSIRCLQASSRAEARNNTFCDFSWGYHGDITNRDSINYNGDIMGILWGYNLYNQLMSYDVLGVRYMEMGSIEPHIANWKNHGVVAPLITR